MIVAANTSLVGHVLNRKVVKDMVGQTMENVHFHNGSFVLKCDLESQPELYVLPTRKDMQGEVEADLMMNNVNFKNKITMPDWWTGGTWCSLHLSFVSLFCSFVLMIFCMWQVASEHTCCVVMDDEAKIKAAMC